MTFNECTTEKHDLLKKTACFLSKYAASLMACGTTTIRIEKNVVRIAEAFKMHVEITILPLHVMLTVWDESRKHSYISSQRITGNGLNFYTNTLLSRLSWTIYTQRLSLSKSIRLFEKIVSVPRINKWLVLTLVGLANASFCALFNGDYTSMAIVFVATIDGFYIKNKLHGDWHWDIRITTIISAFVASVISCSGYIFHWGDTPDVALATSVLFLVPGIPFINSVSDLIHGHYICFMSRCIQATILTICLSLGLCLALLIMNISV